MLGNREARIETLNQNIVRVRECVTNMQDDVRKDIAHSLLQYSEIIKPERLVDEIIDKHLRFVEALEEVINNPNQQAQGNLLEAINLLRIPVNIDLLEENIIRPRL